MEAISSISEQKENKLEELEDKEKSRGRLETRRYELYKNTNKKLQEQWTDLEQIIKVHRVREIKGLKSEETAYFITNKKAELRELADGIRNHWVIENSLHWVKDVTFGEDATRHKTDNLVVIKSILINVAMNVLRDNENKYLKRTMRLCCNDITCLIAFLE